MKKYGLLIVSTAMFFCGCQSNEKVALAPKKRLRSDSTESPSPTAVSGLRESGTVKAYGMGRYVDPTDPRIMHERHAIYRLEEQPAWITRSPKNQPEVILGPIVGLKRAEYAPEPLPGETAREIVNARHGIEQANDSISAVLASQEKLASSVSSLAKETADAERKLTSVVSILNDRVKHLEAESGNARDERAQGPQTESPEAGMGTRPSN